MIPAHKNSKGFMNNGYILKFAEIVIVMTEAKIRRSVQNLCHTDIYGAGYQGSQIYALQLRSYINE
jgi:hypothetical protein